VTDRKYLTGEHGVLKDATCHGKSVDPNGNHEGNVLKVCPSGDI
jgi:hypothetical protein